MNKYILKYIPCTSVIIGAIILLFLFIDFNKKVKVQCFEINLPPKIEMVKPSSINENFYSINLNKDSVDAVFKNQTLFEFIKIVNKYDGLKLTLPSSRSFFYFIKFLKCITKNYNTEYVFGYGNIFFISFKNLNYYNLNFEDENKIEFSYNIIECKGY